MRRRSKYGLRTYGDALDLGMDPDGGRWVVICDDHHTCANVDTRAQAAKMYTYEFCEDCEN